MLALTLTLQCLLWICLAVVRGSVALVLQPGGDFVVPVAHATADAETAGTGAEVAPVAQGGHGDADDVGDFTDGEQFVVTPARSDTLVLEGSTDGKNYLGHLLSRA